MAERDAGNVVDLTARAGYRPDIAAMARTQVATARQRLGLTSEEFAEVLKPLLGWAPSAGVVENWETKATPPGDVLIAAGIMTQAAPVGRGGDGAREDILQQLVGGRFADVEAIFTTRSEFTSQVPPQVLFANAHQIDAAGLSLNLLCQQYSDHELRDVIESGASLRCLFLEPFGDAIGAREREEDYPPGHLSALTEMNMQILLKRVRERLQEDDQQRVQVATYDETIRFNIVLVDREVGVVQPYLPATRGVESPTFLLRRGTRSGLLTTFEQTFMWLLDRSSPV